MLNEKNSVILDLGDDTTLQVPTELYVAGRWVPSPSNPITVLNPATGQSIASVSSATIEHAIAAVDAASQAQQGWAAHSPRDRAEILHQCYVDILLSQEKLARLITLENGKPLSDSRAEISYAAEFFRWYAEQSVRNIGQMSRSPSNAARILVSHKAAGVALLVTPWNYPAAMGTRKIAPALAAGCSVVIKPASETPLTMLALMPILSQAGVPDGVVNVITSSNSSAVVNAALQDGRVRVLSFTGSTAVGRQLLKSAADTIVTPAMELGGNAPFVVMADADLDAAVEGAMVAKMRNLGEACTAANRFYIHESLYEEFAQRLTARMQALRIGEGLVNGVEVGALVNAATLSKVEELVDDAIAGGARILTGGARLDRPGNFYPPTVLVDVPRDARCFREEIFGPVAALCAFTDEDPLVDWCNDTEYGLVAYVYTRDLKRGMQFAERLEFGMIGLNRGLVSDPAAPFGGMKQSGIGREGAQEGMMEFLETQYVSTEW